MTGSQSKDILPGFNNPIHDSQTSFRALLQSIARPGRIYNLPRPVGIPDLWSPAQTAIALTLFDQDTPVWIEQNIVSTTVIEQLKFHCACPIVCQPDHAAFAVGTGATLLDNLHKFPIGDPQYPEKSATIIVAVESLTSGVPLRLRGPGVKGEANMNPKGLPTGFVSKWMDNHGLYPSGIDVFFTAGDQVIGLPRTTAIEEA
jgi:alpha-D-ribose 1-methylphosphonate 5-triphosphate synthase subunit PhnH